MTKHLRQLEALIDERPDDRQRYLVLSDELQARGSRLGEWLMLNLTPEVTEGDDEQREARAAQLLALREDLSPFLLGTASDADRRHYDFTWRWGFVERLRFIWQNDDGRARLQTLLKLLSQVPALRFVREFHLHLDATTLRDDFSSGREEWQQLLEVLESSGPALPTTLTTLRLSGRVAPTSPLWLDRLIETFVPTTLVLDIGASGIQDGAAEHPSIERIEVHAPSPLLVSWLERARWPNATTLVVTGAPAGRAEQISKHSLPKLREFVTSVDRLAP